MPATPSPLATRLRLDPDLLRWSCPPELIPAETTEEVEPIEGIIGQERAIKALKLGVELFSPGYNIFVCGLSGTGKATTIKSILEKIHPTAPPPKDYCYVYNFHDEDRPTLLAFEKGKGSAFKKDIDAAIAHFQNRIPKIFEEENFVRQRAAIIDEYNQKEAELFTAFEEKISADGFLLGRIQEGQLIRPELMVKIGEKSYFMQDLSGAVAEKLITQEEGEAIVERYNTHRNELQDVFRKGVQITRIYQKRVADYEAESISTLVHAVIGDVRSRYPDEKVGVYLNDFSAHLLANVEPFKPQEGRGEGEAPDAQEQSSFLEYAVNLLLDNAKTEGCPVVIETVPTFVNLFGAIEKSFDARGFWYTNFTHIKAGSLLRADGGYLVINAFDALTEPGVWKGLQRVLLNRKLEIQGIDAYFQMSSSIIKPEPLDLNVKVIMVGNNEIYSMLDAYEHDFKKIFKVKADFDYEMDNSAIAVQQYAALIRKLCQDENLKHFDKGAIAAVVEHGARLADSKTKLTTRFSEVADIVREANYWCAQNSNTYVTAVHVAKAVRETEDRYGLYREKLQEIIRREVILIDVAGARTGQVNGLAVYSDGTYSFGKPTRITASVAAGEGGIINIEREAKMSGSTHDKGVLILGGYLRSAFAQKKPLALTASVCFEQSYSGVDGDSASSTEIYALLSALAGAPIRQDLAVTGSVNQQGDIQPIGGVNEKIEGFYEVCADRGLTGTQGVIIPAQNVENLMLKPEVVDAVRAGRFHLYAVSRIDEGIELLTGKPAGARKADGTYPAKSLFGLVQKRLADLAAGKRGRKNGGK